MAIMERMGKRAWILAATCLGVLVAWLWFQNGRINRRRVQAEAALAEVEDEGRGASFAGRPRPAPPARATAPAAEAQAAVASVLPAAQSEPGEPPPAPRHWAVEFFTPHPGENLVAYRDRVLPVVQAVAAPQRKRVRRWRDELVQEARLSDAQQRGLDASVGDAGDQIKDRIFQGVLSGELGPRTKASAGVAFARDVLDIVDGAGKRFRASLSPEQQAALDASRFDFADYLFFATRWEDMLGVEEPVAPASPPR
jgi:hypothetical protein